ncbi:arginine/serine-rich coiled-coil protein 2-like isoform X3 [Watersipora subatra]|uniref:arginine/serine-rich coiled-coil protein 2-like isoform X3 n=1 Tax=Watersipora subatra TaxID=2589382 RepID=UPI00355AF63F
MDLLGKYNSDDEMSNSNPPVSETTNEAITQPGNLESEYENFEKMLASGSDDVITIDVNASSVTESANYNEHINGDNISPSIASNAAPSAANNPYAYLSSFTDVQLPGGTSTHEDMEKQLEEFLEKTAQAAGIASMASEHLSASDHTDSDSASHSGCSSHSRSQSRDKESHEKESQDKDKDSKEVESKESRAATIKRLEEMNPDRRGSRRRSSSRSRQSRSHRSRSKSRRSRSRSPRSHSRSRRHRRRSGSHSRRRRHHRRSGSRHRRRSHRSRSPRRRRARERDSGRNRRSRRRRSRRRSNSRERKQELKKAQYAAILQQQHAALPSKTEDFKSKMKRELQQAAKDAMAGKGQATPQQALLQTMAAMHAKAQELTGVEVPKFYNPAAINPLKFAEQQQKRKLLWSKAAENKEQSLQKFQGTEVVADEKYRKLMGIKGEVAVGEMSEEQRRKQSELFNQLDQEYALARITTHTHRGMGLGVVSSIAAQSANEQFNKP